MSRRLRAVAAFTALLTMVTALLGLPSQAAAASCSGWTSSATPPPTIRVFRHASGAVHTVSFKAYAKNVLSREWIASWTTESLRSGALAVKHYAWYQVLHWRGGKNAAGECFDIRDDTVDQVYDPSKPTYTTAAAAVDATWATRVLKSGSIFPTYYNAGASGERCGVNANGWKMYQWGSQACGLAGKTAAQIMLIYYYPNVTVADAPAPSATPTPTPTPKPTASPKPSATATPSPAPSSPSPTRTPRPTPTPSPEPTAKPTPTPSPSSEPLATPPPSQSLPGGGQSGIVNAPSPPPPPPSDPEPTVARAAAEPTRTEPLPISPASLRWGLDWAVTGGFATPSAWAGLWVIDMQAPVTSSRVRLATFSIMWRAAMDQLARGLAYRFASTYALRVRPVAAND
jgi:hypothetical protein